MDYVINNTKTKEEMYNMVCKIFEDVIIEPMMSMEEYFCWKVYVFFDNGLSFMCMMNENEDNENEEYYKLIKHYGCYNINFIVIIGRDKSDTVYTNNKSITIKDWEDFYNDPNNHRYTTDYFEEKFTTKDTIFLNYEVDRSDFHLNRYY